MSKTTRRRPASAPAARSRRVARRPAAHFKVHPKLAALLGETYRSSEEALKELVDNAWDADAEHVSVSLPDVVSTQPIVIQDDGTGMTERELREVYLQIANDRRSRKGTHTAGKKRLVKGRKGIGKFAGLMAADSMLVETRSRGTLTRLRITKSDLLDAGNAGKRDLESVDLAVVTETCDERDHGTTITLSGLAQNLTHPSPARLRELLVVEYDRKEQFEVTVDGERVAIDDIQGEMVTATENLASAGAVDMKFTVAEGALRQSGIVIRVDGKVIGKPSMLGLEEDPEIPPKLLRRVFGEIDADALAPEVTSDWGAIVENSRGLQEVRQWAAGQLKQKLGATFKTEVSLQKARLQKEVNQRLAKLPENRRKTAEQAIARILEKLYGENEERQSVVVSLMLDAFEKDEYWLVLKSIDEATQADVGRLAGVLDQFGLVDLAVVGQQAKGRLAFLDQFDALIANPATLEKEVHTAIERNLWILGPDHRLVTSNQSLSRLVDQWGEKKYAGEKGKQRPDLFLGRSSPSEYLLVEFKRPSHAITRADEGQAATYRDELAPSLPQGAIDVLVLGGRRDKGSAAAYDPPRFRVTSYVDIVARARDELAWLLKQLADEG